MNNIAFLTPIGYFTLCTNKHNYSVKKWTKLTQSSVKSINQSWWIHHTALKWNLWQTVSCIKCDRMGAVFHSLPHDFSIVIPEGAVPKGVVISIEIGLTLIGPFDYPSLDESKLLCSLFSSCMFRISLTFNFSSQWRWCYPTISTSLVKMTAVTLELSSWGRTCNELKPNVRVSADWVQ